MGIFPSQDLYVIVPKLKGCQAVAAPEGYSGWLELKLNKDLMLPAQNPSRNRFANTPNPVAHPPIFAATKKDYDDLL